jgi:polysaccharide export outer membrane protein
MELQVPKLILAIVTLGLYFPALCYAQTSAPAPAVTTQQTPAQTSAQTPAQTSESLLIGPGDLVSISVFDTPEMNQDIRVSDAGTVRLQLVGDLNIGGQTPAAAAKTIEDALISHQIMKAPQVSVHIKDYITQDVSILGEVKNPGPYQITTPQTVLRVLALAGGLADDADRKITIARHGDPNQKITYYLANNADLAMQAAVMIDPGDTVIVPRAPVVYIMGDVARPGGYSIATNDSKLSMLQLVAMAGSTNKTAKTGLKLIRKDADGQQKEIPVQLSAIQKGKQPDIFLQQGDIVYVPFSWMRNAAMTSSGIAASTSSAMIYVLH